MTTTRTARHRPPARKLGRWVVPATAMFWLWIADNDPGSAAGFTAFLAGGVLFSLFYPLAVLLALEAPGALVPARWRAWHRHGQEGRPHISNRLRRITFAADGHMCGFCRSSGGIQLDHVRPWSLGGRTCFWNMMTLCAYHNQVKSNYWVDRDGYVHYRPWEGYHRPGLAAEILAFELRRRWSIIRFIRASMAL
jgi:hypothetical protein